jgi:uncharacterized repeat protein (TIGR01451 family)
MLVPASSARLNKLYLSRLLVIAFTLLLFGSSAVGQNLLYHMRGNAGPGVSNNIWAFNPATGVETLIYANYPGGNAATIAQRSDGMLFYAINATNGDVYRFNPATPNVAPVRLGPIGPDLNTGTNVSGGFRMAFSGNTLYYMVGNAGTDANRLYTVNQTSGRATSVSTLNLTNNGGDIAFNGGTMNIVDQNRNLFTSTTLTGSATAAGTIAFPVSGTAPNTIGIAFIGGQMYLQTVGDSAAKTAIWSVSGTNATFINQIGGGNSATGDMASANVTAPNLSITKTDNVTSVYRGGPVSYTITVTNLGTYAVRGTVSDNVPASVTVSGWTCATTAPSFCGPPASGGAGNNISATVTLEPAASATFTVNGTLSATASGTLVNTATVAVPPWLTDSNTTNNTATDTDAINLNANLGITKTDGLANINPGSAISYSVVVSNAGPDGSVGSIVTDTVPATITGVTWTCGTPTGGATCGAASGSGNSISTTANLPSGSSVTYTISGSVSPTATGTLSNTASVITPASGVSDPTDLGRTGAGNNSATDNTTINPIPVVGLVKSVSPSGNQSPGTDLGYTIAFNNTGTAVARTIVIGDPIPANTDFRIGSMTSALGTTGLTVSFSYSNNGGTTYVYTPVSGGGGAPAGYDRLVTHVRWTFTGNLSQTVPNNAGSVGFTVRIR